MPDNPLVSEGEANEVLDNLKTFLTDLNERVDLGYFFGLAFDEVNPEADRERFATAIKHLLIKQDDPDRQRPKLLVCIDPNLSYNNIDRLFRNLRGIRDVLGEDRPLRRIEPVVFRAARENAAQQEENTVPNQQILPIEPNERVYQGGRNTSIIPIERRNRDPYARLIEPASITHPEQGNPFFYKMTFKILPDRPEGFTAVYYVYFLRYGLTTPRTAVSRENRSSSYVGKHTNNQINIQATIPERQKRISNYTESCTYDSQSFYAHLESLGNHENVKDIYVASALSSNDSFHIKEINGEMYGSVIETSPGIAQFREMLSNRYFEDFCEILRVMKKLSDAGKHVLFIQLDSAFRVFNHPAVPRTSRVPYEVSFDERTKFFINSPKFFRKIRLPGLNDPPSTPIRILAGGKKTKKQRRKSRKTRKHSK